MLLPCGVVRTSLDDRNLRGQTEPARERVVSGRRRCCDVPTVLDEAYAWSCRGDNRMTIVTNSGPARRKRAKPAQPAEITAPRIVQHVPRWKRQPKPWVRDPESEARVEAFFRRMGLKLPDDWGALASAPSSETRR
jgi:hypothetical protein